MEGMQVVEYLFGYIVSESIQTSWQQHSANLQEAE